MSSLVIILLYWEDPRKILCGKQYSQLPFASGLQVHITLVNCNHKICCHTLNKVLWNNSVYFWIHCICTLYNFGGILLTRFYIRMHRRFLLAHNTVCCMDLTVYNYTLVSCTITICCYTINKVLRNNSV